ncbi:MAG: hypothetical protein KUG78_17325 [Kangiellaceae bacterium]|nr:hypothetical protein [Kangiellaceae bacterium]
MSILPTNFVSNCIQPILLIMFLTLASACGGSGGGGSGSGGVGGGGGNTDFTLTVQTTGSGIVTSSPSGISCGADCTEDYDSASSVNLTATADSGHSFVGWGGACTGTGSCSISMSADRSVTAEFQQISTEEFTLTVQTSGAGSVTSNPSGINCGSDCSEDFLSTMTVNLTASADNGHSFIGWSGACSGTGACAVSMTSSQSVSAEFQPNSGEEFTLSVETTGSGTVTSNPSGIDCGSVCSQSFSDTTSVILTATAESGNSFVGWGGACSGVGNCTVPMSSNQSVTADFQQSSVEEFQLQVQIQNASGGKVVFSPTSIECSDDCSASVQSNTSVHLFAEPDPGFKLESWQGECTGSAACSFLMNGNKTLTASFVAQTLSIDDMGTHEIAHGEMFNFQPVINGTATICRKDLGHDDVSVDSETGLITWDTTSLNFGRGFHIRIKCSNFDESAYASLVIHVDKSGTSRLRVAGEEGVSPFIGVAGQAMTSGDTIIFPDGNYPVSVSRDESYENAFKGSAPTAGSSDQFSTIISLSPGGAVINGEAQSGIPKQKNAFQLGTNSFVAIVGFVVKNVLRESMTNFEGATNTNLLIDFVGAKGAGTNGEPCSNFSEAGSGWCSNAGMRINGGNPLFQSSYDWGHNRYGIMTRSTNGSVTRRSFVRLDEHKGDQPYGGFSNYCDTLHLSQDNTVFDSLAIAAPHYKNYAGLEAYPATGCENDPATLATNGTLSVNNKLSLSLMDAKAGPTHTWDNVVSYDSQGTCTPQTNRCGLWLLQSDKSVDVSNSFFGLARAFDGATSPGQAFGSNVNFVSNVALDDVAGVGNSGARPGYLPENQLYFNGRSDTFHGDPGFNSVTTSRRWPIPGEDIIAKNMRAYRNTEAFRVGGGTVDIDGNRGASIDGETMSEYFWGYINDLVPPLVVRVKNKGSAKRVAWEHLSGTRRNFVTGWKVLCTSTSNSVLATLAKETLVYSDSSSCTSYAVLASYAGGDSGIAYNEVAN